MSSRDPTSTCGCCAGFTPATPVSLWNRPGLDAVLYRVGTHPRFKASLLARLATSNHPALQQLTTRRDDDFSIALCDAWATVADVLTFYQERLANESWLRTATERRSVRELARLVDYALRPGVAASTHLAFDLETAPGSPAEVDIAAGTKVMSVPGPGEKPQTFETIDAVTARGTWNRLSARRTESGSVAASATSVELAGAGLDLKVGDRFLFLGAGRRVSNTSTDWEVRTLSEVVPDRENDRTVASWADPLPDLGEESVEVRVLRRRSPLMGSAAPDPRNLASSTQTQYSSEFERSSVGGPIIDWLFAVDGERAYLDGVFNGVLAGDYLLLETDAGVQELFDVTSATVVTRRAYSLSARATQVSLEPATSLADFHGQSLRGTTAYFETQPLPLADVPITAPVSGSAITLDTLLADEPPGGRLLLVAGTDADTGEPAGETVTLLETDQSGQQSVLVLTSELVHFYLPDSVVIRGNVAAATHGETVRETVGSGDGSKPLLRTKLRQPPLTYVPARNPTGAESTLELRVNGLAWQEIPSLFEAGPRDRVYTVRHEEDSSTVIEFGDGVNGARVPTGLENVSAVYRKGIGTEGHLDPGQLSQLLTRPLGVKDVANPLPAAGAADAETIDEARVNCTLTIHTLDRIVSLQDYEDYARAFAGVSKSLATWFWDGRQRGVLLTVAGADGEVIDAASSLPGDLVATIRQWGDPHIPVDVRSFSPASFAARVAVAADPERLREDVLASVRDALEAAFSFAARSFAQPVTLDEVLAAAQSATGVVAANVTRLTRTGGEVVEPRLVATGPQMIAGEPVGAELLLLDPALLELTDLA